MYGQLNPQAGAPGTVKPISLGLCLGLGNVVRIGEFRLIEFGNRAQTLRVWDLRELMAMPGSSARASPLMLP